jgi:hypothetical protein
MKTILFYGNCQVGAVQKTLNLQNFKEERIWCFNTEISCFDFTNLIKKSDIIVTQPINDNYKGKSYLSTKYIIENCKNDCKIIIFDSCHFDFYYFDLTYKFLNPNELLVKPIDYHYNGMIDCFKNKLSIENYIHDYVDNIDLKTQDELEELANKSLNELKRRYNETFERYKTNDNVYIISTHDFIKENYKNKLLFYSMNHPTKYLIQFICENIVNILRMKNNIDYNVDVLDCTRCIIYKSIQKCVIFDINNEIPLTNNFNDNYSITKMYYDTYTCEGINFN